MWTRLSLGNTNPWFAICYDPISLGTLAVSAVGTGLGLYQQKKAAKAAKSQLSATLQPQAEAPSERSPKILAEAASQLEGLQSLRGREATRLSKKKRRGTYLDEAGGDGIDTAPAYTNTTLG